MTPPQAAAQAKVIATSSGLAYPEYGQAERRRTAYVRLKRILDIIVVAVAAPAVLAVIALAALAIFVSMGRPIFFLNDRVGLNGRLFKMIKLRTMTPGETRPQYATLRNDPRVTPIGNFLRQTHIDELPQLWNIILGDMTLIGPRPEQPHLVEYYREQISNYDVRHTVTPGLSGWSQVCFGYATDLEETKKKLAFDLEYVENLGARIDLNILWRTLRVYLDPNFVR
jgi:lipopolysaccharide/colanic/teichoic acid biosynthesis glycosyltransferase